jgi:MinD superfamily P-loop ATPase
MRKVCISLALIVMVLALSSCQTIDHFVVVNRSDAHITEWRSMIEELSVPAFSI